MEYEAQPMNGTDEPGFCRESLVRCAGLDCHACDAALRAGIHASGGMG